MLVYILISILLTGLAIINPKSKTSKKIVYLFLGIFLCTSYFNGSDWRSYEIMYELARLEEINNFHREKGFYIYMCIFKMLGFSFFEFFIITKFIIYYIFYRVLIKSPNFYLVLNIFYYQMALFLFIDCPLRNLIAIGLVLLGKEQLDKKKRINFLICIILATFFHKTAIFFIIIPLAYKINKLSNIWIIMGVILCYILLINQEILIRLLKFLPLFQDRLFHYIGSEYSEARIFSLGNLEKIGIIASAIYYRYKYKKNLNIISLIIIYFLLYRIAITFPILGRIALYVQIFYIFGIGLVIGKLKMNMKVMLILFFGIYGILNIYKTINNTYKYIPYTSYLNYIGKEKPSYNYRRRYHYIEYIKRNGTDELIKKYINK